MSVAGRAATLEEAKRLLACARDSEPLRASYYHDRSMQTQMQASMDATWAQGQIRILTSAVQLLVAALEAE